MIDTPKRDKGRWSYTCGNKTIVNMAKRDGKLKGWWLFIDGELEGKYRTLKEANAAIAAIIKSELC